jgi:hypothetical protein
MDESRGIVTLESRIYKWIDDVEARFPDDDPGDLSITWQDDSHLVTASQAGFIGFGHTADEALDSLILQRTNSETAEP